jgi:hypothetical protein
MLVLQSTLPWHVRYTGFIGTLPSVRIRVQILNAGLAMSGGFGGQCLYRISPFFIIEGPVGGSSINTGNAALRMEEAQEFPSEGFGCPSARFAARAPVTLLNTTTAITLRLI